ncbi:uroporphyrinogen-III synthase [Helicobacter sp. 11S02629-2]|uniref:uroporphyrinogen-III synthase n=1 Tax=Helicobacter sp. 11S02629-2 TaxID=1476195 RepID=UPI000BA7B6B2|nr:uroporphyrinogen-III synthase [Helicobacter sp. 11S02629-2]PAF45443.1 hypothetical protein BKH40_02965 [Helicobacter sp. 11S02629-2]
MIYLLKHGKDDSPKVCSFSLLKIAYLKANLGDVREYEYLLLTSKYALFWILDSNNLECLKGLKILSVGKKTSKFCKEAGLKVYFSGSGGIKELKDALKDGLKDKSILYLRASKTAFDAKEVFKKSRLKEVVVYESVKSPFFYIAGLRKQSPVLKLTPLNSLFKKDSIFIFSAPSHFESFYNVFGWRKDFYALAIGTTTFSALSKCLKSKRVFCKNGLSECLSLAREIETSRD